MSSKTILRTLGVLLTGALLSVSLGCATDDGGGGSEANKEIARTGATNAVDAARSLKSIKGDAKAQAALGDVAGMYTHLQRIAIANAAAKKDGGIAGTGIGALTAALSEELSPDCVEIKDKTVTYTDCTLTGLTLSGTITLDGNHITFSLDLTVDPKAYSLPEGSELAEVANLFTAVAVHEEGDMTITATDVDGTVDAVITMTVDKDAVAEATGVPATVAGVSTIPSEMTQTMKATFDVQLTGTPPCATSGTIVVQNTAQTGVVTAGEGTTTATFGPECKDVAVE